MGARDYRPLLALAGIVVLLLAQQLGHFGRADLLGRAVNNSLHVPLFALIALLIARVLPRPTPLRVFAACAGLGALTELLQIPGARSASVIDLLLDFAGAGTVAVGLALSSRMEQSQARVAGVWAAVGVGVLLMTMAAPVRVLAAYAARDRAFPVVFDPASRAQALLWSSNSAVRVRDRPRDAPFRSLRVLEVVWSHAERYPGVTVAEVVPDWSGYARLEVEAWLPPGPPMPLTAAVGHRGIEGTAAHQRQVLHPGFQRLTYAVPVLMAGERDAPEITKLILHTREGQGGRRLLIGTARLNGDGSVAVGPGGGTGSR